jgi:membrane dipeptidase
MMTTRREMLGGAAALAALAVARPAISVARTQGFDDWVVIDGLGMPDDPDGKEGDPKWSPRAIRQFHESGITAFQITVGQVGNEPDTWDNTLSTLSFFNRAIEANPGALMAARTAGEIRTAKSAGKVALVYGTQDTAMVGTQLDRLDLLQGLGVRVVQLTYNLRNLSGDGSLEPANGGISNLGRATIARIEAGKMLLDLSHGGARTIPEAVTAATRPPTISHTGCRSLYDNPRNVWDSEMKAVADKGGVVGIYWMPFLVPNSRPTAADLVRHMRHAVDVCGEDHVSIGTDGILGKTVIDDKMRASQAKFFNDRKARGIAAPGEGPDIFNIVAELDSPLRFRMLADALAKDGWPSSRIEKVLGANLLRLYGEVWGV